MRKYVNYSSKQTGYVKIATMKTLVRRAKIVPGTLESLAVNSITFQRQCN